MVESDSKKEVEDVTSINGYQLPESLQEPKKRRKLNLNPVIRTIFELAGVGGGAGLGKLSFDSVNLTPDGLNLIYQQFVQSGAENIQTSPTGITNFAFGAEDGHDVGGVFYLNNPMDFSSVPQLYVNSGQQGLNIVLGTAIPTAAAQILLSLHPKTNKSYIKGPLAMTRWFGAGYGIAKIIASYLGLKNMPYTITNPGIDTFTLTGYSAEPTVSSINIGPLVQAAQSNLEGKIVLGGVVIGGAEAVCIGIDLGKYVKKQRAGVSSMEKEALEKLKERIS